MITIHVKDLNHISQKFYDDIIAMIDIRKLICTCGNCKSLIHHGNYSRTVKTPNGAVRLRINRVKCTICGCTHAILLSSIIPYSQIVLKDQMDIINCYENQFGYDKIFESNLSIDENNVHSVILRYCRYWKPRILSYDPSVFSVELLIKYCFSIFQRQFMQIKSTSNRLFMFPT